MTGNLRLAVYDLGPGQISAPKYDSAVYFLCPWSDVARPGLDDTSITLPERLTGTAIVLDGGSGWLFEAAPASSPPPDARVILSRTGEFPDRSLVRLDRVRSAAGGRTPPHRHQGPGVRRLVQGEVLAMADDAWDRILAGGAWFETGDETIIGQNGPGVPVTFLRMLLLPPSLSGGASSFVAVDSAPNATRNSVVDVIAEVQLTR